MMMKSNLVVPGFSNTGLILGSWVAHDNSLDTLQELDNLVAFPK